MTFKPNILDVLQRRCILRAIQSFQLAVDFASDWGSRPEQRERFRERKSKRARTRGNLRIRLESGRQCQRQSKWGEGLAITGIVFELSG